MISTEHRGFFGTLLAGILGIVSLLASGICVHSAEQIRVLIVDGQNNHDWRKTSPVLKSCLEATGRFKIDVVTTPGNGKPAEDWNGFRPKFADYGAVMSNYNGQSWPEPVQKSLEEYVSGGGGLVIVHAANNAFPEWSEYNKMIGLGWRGADYGARVTTDNDGKVILKAKSQGPGAGHGSQHDFAVVVRDRQHPVMSGIPVEWMHVKDELYHGQRGPAANMNILATAFSAKSTGGTDEHEPMVWWIPYGKGKVFTTVFGHGDYSMKCVGFQTVLVRGTEWVATDKVTLPVPARFPTATTTLSIDDVK
ncbi:MAG: ThuA domain-containing protein [Schlesneria sp.]